MPRSPALKESDWFELADDVVSAGQQPTTKLLASIAQERYGISSSYTTIQRALDSWRRLGGADRPREFSPEFLQIVLKGFSPIYQQLLTQARAEFEPRLLEAETHADAASARLETLRGELQRLTEERDHLRAQLHSLTAREREQTAALASAQTKASELQGLIDSVTATHQQQLTEIQGRVNQQEARHAREREQMLEQHRLAIAEIKESFEAEIAQLLTRSRVEMERRDGELGELRESLQQAQAARSALGAQKQALEEQLSSAMTLQAELHSQLEKLREELKSAQGRVQRAEQALRDARAANSQMEAAYQQRINQLQAQLETLVKGQASIQQHFEELVRQIAHGRAVPSSRTPHG